LKFKVETEFQETEIGKIPKEWRIVRFGELFEFQRGFSYRKTDITSFQTSIRFITINDLEKEGGLKKNVEPTYLSEKLKDSIERKHVAEVGDLLIAITDMSKGFIIGAPLYISEELKSQGDILVYSMDLVKLYPKKYVDTRFYFYLLTWDNMRRIMKSLAHGTNVLHLDLDLVKRVKLVEPPIGEQKRIAETLLFIDKVLESVDESVDRLERLKKALMRELLTGRIRVNEENGKLVFHRETEFQETEIGKIPKGWQVASLADVAEYINGYPFKPSDWSNSGLPIIRIQNLNDPSKPFNYYNGPLTPKHIEVLVDNGDLLFAWSASFGFYMWNRGRAILNQHIYKVNPKRSVINKLFLYYSGNYYLNLHVKTHTVGSTMRHIRKSTLNDIKLPLPPLEEQLGIAEVLSAVDRAIELYHEKKVRLERLKKGLMNLLLTGKIRVLE